MSCLFSSLELGQKILVTFFICLEHKNLLNFHPGSDKILVKFHICDQILTVAENMKHFGEYGKNVTDCFQMTGIVDNLSSELKQYCFSVFLHLFLKVKRDLCSTRHFSLLSHLVFISG